MPKLGNSVRVGWDGTTSMHFQPGEITRLETFPNCAILYELVGVELHVHRCIFNLVGHTCRPMVGDMPKLRNSGGHVGYFGTTSMRFQSCEIIWFGTRPNGAILYELVGLEHPRCIFNLVR